MLLDKLKEGLTSDIIRLTMLCLKGSEEVELTGSQGHDIKLLESGDCRQDGGIGVHYSDHCLTNATVATRHEVDLLTIELGEVSLDDRRAGAILGGENLQLEGLTVLKSGRDCVKVQTDDLAGTRHCVLLLDVCGVCL
jgi:hypothetical protein